MNLQSIWDTEIKKGYGIYIYFNGGEYIHVGSAG